MKRTCTNCAYTDNTGSFCIKCGTALGTPAAEPVAAHVATPTPVSAPPPTPAPIRESLPFGTDSSTPVGEAATRPFSGTHSTSAGHSSVPSDHMALLSGEVVQVDVRFTPHPIMQHLKTRVMLTNRRTIVHSPNTVMGFIPLGYHITSAPNEAVDRVMYGTKVRGRRMAGGAALVLYGLLGLLTSSSYSAQSLMPFNGAVRVIWALMMMGIGAYLLATARTVGITFDTGGEGMTFAGGKGSELRMVEDTGAKAIEIIDQTRRAQLN